MTVDSVLWIASMTKAVTTAAAMQMVEQGKLKLDQPASEILPDLASAQVLEGFDAAGKPQLRPVKRPVTLRERAIGHDGLQHDDIGVADLVLPIIATVSGRSTVLPSRLIADGLARDPFNPLRHFGGRPARKRHQQDPLGSAPLTIRCATLWASVLVLPLPAPAMTNSGPPEVKFRSKNPCSTAQRCSVLSVSR